MFFDPLCEIRVYSHYFSISKATPRIQSLTRQFASRFTSKLMIKDSGRWITRPDKLYGVELVYQNEWRFHRNSLKDYLDFLKSNYINEDFYKIKYEETNNCYKVDFEVKPEWKPRDYQEPIINFICKDENGKAEYPAKMVGIGTGKGKTSISIFSIARLKLATAIIIKPSYIEQWFMNVNKILKLKKQDVMVVQGGDQLRGLIDLGRQNNLSAKIIIISNRTYLNYIKAYEQDPYSNETQSYNCHPDHFFDTIKVSNLLIDEVHQEFHGNFKIFLYCNLISSISLSATLINHNPFLEKMYNVAFPKAARYDSLELDKYIKAFVIPYSFREPNKVRTTEYGSKNYSHIAFEKSILYRSFVLKPYLGMIKYIIDIGFIDHYQKGDKVLIFAASIAMCTALTNYLKSRYPDRDVRRYVENDPYENLIEGEITVSTILSSGTAHDIPNLRVVINTINIDSAQANIQSMGRLRKLPDRDVKFFYTYCEQLEKHKKFHERRLLLIRDRVQTIKDLKYPFFI